MANGESWTHGEFADFVAFAGFVLVKRTLTLTGVERTGEKRVARIQIRGESPVSFDYTYPIGALHIRMLLAGTMKLTGEILWLVDEGRMQRFIQDVSLDEPVRVEAERLTTTGRFTFKNTEQLDYVPSKN